MKKHIFSYFKILIPLSIFLISDAFAQNSSCSSSMVGQVEGEMVRNMVTTMYSSVGSKLLEWVLFPIFAFCIMLEFSKIVMGGWSKDKTIEWVAYIIVGGMLIGVMPSVNILPSEATRSGASSEILGNIDPDIGTQLYLFSNYMFRNATCESFGGKESQQKMVSDAAEKTLNKISVAFSASSLCSEGDDRERSSCFDNLLNLSNEEIKKELSCPSFSITNSRWFTCTTSKIPALVATSVVVPVLQWVQSALLYFFQLGFLVTLMFTLIFSKFAFATLPHEGSRANSVKMIKFLMALGSFSFILGFINLTTAVLLNSISDAFAPILASNNITFADKLGKAVQMATLIFGAFATQIVFTMQIPKIISAIASGAMDEIGKIASEAMAVGTIGIASVIPYIGAGLSGSLRSNLTTSNGVKGEAPKFRGQTPFQDSNGDHTPPGGGGGNSGGVSQPGNQPNSPAGAGFANLEEEERKKNSAIRANLNPVSSQFARSREILKEMREEGEAGKEESNEGIDQTSQMLTGEAIGVPKSKKTKADSGPQETKSEKKAPKAKPNVPKSDKGPIDGKQSYGAKVKQSLKGTIKDAWQGAAVLDNDKNPVKDRDGNIVRKGGIKNVGLMGAVKTGAGLVTAAAGVGGAALKFAAGDEKGGADDLKKFGKKFVTGTGEFLGDAASTGLGFMKVAGKLTAAPAMPLLEDAKGWLHSAEDIDLGSLGGRTGLKSKKQQS